MGSVHGGKTPDFRSHDCAQCDAKFQYNYLLRQHVQAIHEGIKFQCPECKLFSRKKITYSFTKKKKYFLKLISRKKMLTLFSCLHRWQGVQQEANSEYPHQACAWQNKEFCLSFLFLLCFSGLRFEKTHQKNSQSWIQSRKQRSPTKSPDPTSTSAILTHI